MFRIDITLTSEGNVFTKTVGRRTLDEIKRDEGDFILDLAKDNGIVGEAYSETVISEDGEYIDSDEGFISIYEDYSGFEIG